MPNHDNAPTYGDKVDAGELIYIECTGCGRKVEVRAHAMPPGIPRETPFPLIKTHLRCGVCGGRELVVMPEIYPGGFFNPDRRGEVISSRALVPTHGRAKRNKRE